MIPIFAQADISSIPAGWLKFMIIFMVASIVVMGIIFAAIMSWLQYRQGQKPQQREITPQPLDVQLVEHFVPKGEFKDYVDKNETDKKDLHSKIGGVDRGNGSKLTSEVAAIHIRVNTLQESVGGLKVATDLQNQQLARMDGKLDRLAERNTRHDK